MNISVRAASIRIERHKIEAIIVAKSYNEKNFV